MVGDALLDELGREDIEAAIGAAVDAEEEGWCSYLDAEFSENEADPDWAAEELHEWRLSELRKAGAFLVALVEAEFWLTHPTEDYRGRAIGLEVALVLERDGVEWSVPVREPVFTGWLGEELAAALSYVVEHHAGQTRKGTAIPYLSHVLAVAALAMEMAPGAPEEAIGALLHDVVEDSGGMERAREIAQRFGLDVLRIVLSNSDATVDPKPPWRQRKEEYLAAMADKAPDELRVSLADKLHNARAIRHDLLTSGEDVWSRFNAGRDEVLWYYGELARAFEARKRDLGAGAPFVDELARTVAELRAIAGEGSAPAASGVQAIDDLFAGVADAVGAARPASVTAELDEADRASLDRLLALVGELRITHTLNRDGELLLPIGDGEWTIVLDRVVLDGDTWVSIEVPLAVGMPEAGDLDPSVAQAVEVLVRHLDSWQGVRSPPFENAVVLMCQLPLEGLSSTALLRAMRRVAWVVDQEQDRARALPATAAWEGVWTRMPFDRAISGDSAGVADAPTQP